MQRAAQVTVSAILTVLLIFIAWWFLLYKCCTSDLRLKPFHGSSDDSRHSLDVAALSRSDVLAPEYRLDHNIRNTEFMQVRG